MDFVHSKIHFSSGFGFDFQYLKGKKLCIVTDTTVSGLYLDIVLEQFKPHTNKISVITLPEGEVSKSLDTVLGIYNTLQEKGITRQDYICALGGGVVSDICGFAAATYLRGVKYISFPTTLLSQVDSAYGGKCGVNFGCAKNAVGAFYFPEHIYVSSAFLHTLSDEHIKSGLGEVLKYGCIYSENIFSMVTAVEIDFPALIQASVQAKLHFVLNDLHDHSTRHGLNFGHTIGHCVEVHSSYSVPHGQAVAIGMVYALKIGVVLGKTPKAILDNFIDILEKLHINYKYSFNFSEICDIILKDKKNACGNVNFVVVTDYGCVEELSLTMGQLSAIFGGI